jgi:hypothetical protein
MVHTNYKPLGDTLRIGSMPKHDRCAWWLLCTCTVGQVLMSQRILNVAIFDIQVAENFDQVKDELG